MEPEIPTQTPGVRPTAADPAGKPPDALAAEPLSPEAGAPHPDNLIWIFFSAHGPRTGTSIAIFVILLYIFVNIFGTLLSFAVEEMLHLTISGSSAVGMVLGEAPWVAALLTAAAVMALIERRRVTDYNLAGPRRLTHFIGGLAAGFVALSALVGVMAWGGWLHFGPVSLSGAAIARYGALWAVGFVFVAITEEGTFRCYLQFTLTRGINFWWALAIIGSLCLYLIATARGHGAWGVYAIAVIGLLPCLWLQMRQVPGRGFWQAAWTSSVGFGFVHTGNNGENWIGILAAATIGFVFCVSVRVTGSAWWALGCHGAWDWAETYFYGTADSGFVAHGHYLSAIPAGNALWSGGTDGPEGSLLVLPIILLLLASLALYGRRRVDAVRVPATEHATA
jgi:hypothetical protein